MGRDMLLLWLGSVAAALCIGSVGGQTGAEGVTAGATGVLGATAGSTSAATIVRVGPGEPARHDGFSITTVAAMLINETETTPMITSLEQGATTMGADQGVTNPISYPTNDDSGSGPGYGGYGGYDGYGGVGYGFGGVIAAPVCNQTLSNKNLFPTTFVAFQAQPGDSYSIGEVLFVLAKFPDSSCDVPDPGLMKGCTPKLEVNIAEKYNGIIASAVLLSVAGSTSQVQNDYSVDFTSQPELYKADGTYAPPWVFILQVTAGMRTASLDVNSLYIPPNCSSVNATFNNTKVNFQGTTLVPQGIAIDTTPPQIVAVYTTEKAGRYTAGHFFNIIIKFSKDVQISELPNKYSSVYLNAQAAGVQLFGVPYIEVNSGAFVALRGYDNPNDRSKLSFLYEVGSGEETPTGKQLDIADNTTIQLNGGAITGDFNGLDADLTTVPPYGTVGSMSDKTRPKIYIYKTGEKFPPLKYDPSSTPDTSVVASARRNGQITYTRRVLQPTLVSVDLQLNAIFNVFEKGQQLSADFILVSNWTDPRLVNPSAPAVTTYTTSVIDSGTIWSPRLTFQNRRDLTNYIEGVVRVTNRGEVQVVQRFIAAYAVNLNMRDFPFDVQTFNFNVRSTTYPNTVVKFVPASAASAAASSALLANIIDPTFTYSNYSQAGYTLTTGVFTNYDLLSISIQASRIATMSSIFLVFPLCVVSAVICLVLHQEPAKDARLSVPMGTITATMAFSFVVNNVCPPVSYLTRIHLMILQTYFFSVSALIINYYLWCVEFGRKELARLNGDNKALLNDAHWMPRKIKPPPTNVVVQPDGVFKPEEKPKEEIPADDKIRQDPTVSPDADDGKGGSSEKDSATDVGKAAAADPPPLPPPAGSSAAPTGGGEATALPIKGSAVAPAPEKSADTGAYPDKDGKYKDVKDLLESDEVKTFKKLKWGGGPIKMLWGWQEISNTNAGDWAKHVERVDNWIKNLFPPCIIACIFCILWVKNFPGLGSGPVPYIGVPDLQ